MGGLGWVLMGVVYFRVFSLVLDWQCFGGVWVCLFFDLLFSVDLDGLYWLVCVVR